MDPEDVQLPALAHSEVPQQANIEGQTQCPRDDPGQATTTSTTTPPSHVAKGTKRKAAAEEAQDLLAQLLSRGAVPDLRQRLRDLRQPANPLHNKIDAWVCYLAAELHDFQPRVWNRFVSAATLLLHQCKEQNELQGASNDFPTKIWSPPVCTSNTKLQGASNNNFPTNIWSPPPPVCTSNTNTYYNDIDDDNNYDDIDDIETKCMQ
ncbi:hypothetical protein GWK47_022621 [Chionoecetes opilio]|uniref:Uncharacterized protein n=1 Tax=Chionoecetes opilio TaxID=41210 RepID=A0A8J4XQH3_CHIOP|nr:hypothetical protein GWK47_022621 [Chionoecetes opilio]